MNPKFRINPQLILTFLVIAKTQSVTRAAEILVVTPTAISKQLKQLEEVLQQSLFERTTRRMSLTDFGELFYQQCERVKNELDNAANFAQSFQKQPAGQLNIVCAEHAAQEYLLKHLRFFAKKYPAISYKIEIAERIPDMHREKIDLLIGFSQNFSFGNDLRAKKLFSTQHVLCASPSYLRENGAVQTIDDLQNCRFIDHILRSTNTKLNLAKGKTLIINKPYLLVNTMTALMQLCLDGLGIALLTHSMADPYIKQKKLIPILPELAWRPIEVYLFYHFTAYEQPKIRAFIDFIT